MTIDLLPEFATAATRRASELGRTDVREYVQFLIASDARLPDDVALLRERMAEVEAGRCRPIRDAIRDLVRSEDAVEK